ncbi:MAG: hypothetical protein F4Y50_05760 [Dehalococcoidia bacterium]|nr:hypothetical protein [Dehalococcoidia bacterium]
MTPSILSVDGVLSGARRCKRCRRFHLARAGSGGDGSMPWRVSEEWLQEHGCPRREFGDVPIPSCERPTVTARRSST